MYITSHTHIHVQVYVPKEHESMQFIHLLNGPICPKGRSTRGSMEDKTYACTGADPGFQKKGGGGGGGGLL